MPKWVSVVLVIVVFFAVAIIYESWRSAALATWCRQQGFTRIDPFVPAQHPPILMAASQLTGRDGNFLRWASAWRGQSAGLEVTFAEVEYTPTGRKSSVWFTLAVWPSSAVPAPLTVDVLSGQNAIGRAMRKLAGTSVGVFGDPAARQAWLNEKRLRAMEEWRHGGQFVLLDGHAGWMTEGLLTPARADELLARIPEARRAFQ